MLDCRDSAGDSINECNAFDAMLELQLKAELTVVLSFQAYLAFRRAILDLYLAKRIQDPVWLSMMTFSAGRKVHICTRFVQEFVIAKEQYEKRNQL